MKYTLFIDESGDHGLKNIDVNYPVLTLTGILATDSEYNSIKECMNNCKSDIWGSKDIIFHSTDIRKWYPPFDILSNTETRQKLYVHINNFFIENEFRIFSSVINKLKLTQKYSYPLNQTYEYAFLFIIERVLLYLKHKEVNSFKIIIESRGKREDNELNQFFDKIYNYGSTYIHKNQLKNLNSSVKFLRKSLNINGLQLADLAAYPISRYTIDSSKENKSFELVKKRFHTSDSLGINFIGYGLKIFP